MKRVVLLATAALVAMLVLAPTAMAQEDTTLSILEEDTMIAPLPESGGAISPSVLLPAAALLLGSGVLAYAVLRRG